MASKRLIKNFHFKLTIFFVVGCYALVYSQTTPIPDSNFEQALIDYNIDTNGLNGNILNSDAENILTLNIFSKNITSLQGIEAFVNLRHLYCYYNNIETLNLQDNLLLEVLDIENNSIQSIDLSANSLLEEVYISNNLLDEIDVSQNTALEVLSCNLNNISELDVTNNPNLEVLWCYSNTLSNLDISQNLLLESLFCGENFLTDLDVTNNYLLESISCADNAIQSFTFSDCLDLKYLDVSSNDLDYLDISSNHNLKRILCSNNNIETLDVSNADELMLLYASNNILTEMDLSFNNELKYVRINNNQLTTLDLRNANNHDIREFNAEGNANLTCLFVDNINASYLNDWILDSATTFVNNESECNALSTEEVSKLISFKIYPNPVSDWLFVNVTEKSSSLTIFDVSGKQVKTQSLVYGKNDINLSHLHKGVYFVTMATGNSQAIITKKIIVD